MGKFDVGYLMRVLVLIGTLLIAGLPSQVLAAPLTEEAAGYISDEVFVAHFGMDPKAATASLKYCRNAEQKAAQYDRHPYFDALIADCFGTLEARSKNKQAACGHYARALERYRVLPVSDPYYSKDFPEHTRKKRLELGC